MKFQLHNLIIWPKAKEFAPQIIKFEEGKLNVITGESRTGKSAIIPIIDYCLASSDCHIPIDTIRDHASWYGVVFKTESEKILISRKVPEGNRPSNDFYLVRGLIVSIPNEIAEPNENSEGIKQILNSISGVPYLGINDDAENNNHFKARLSFRDLMALVFQSQDIVANQNILFYKTHAHEHREKLRNWFPFILGAETIETLAAKQRMRFLELRIGQLSREYEKIKNVSNSWMANMLGHLKVAKEYGILEQDVSYDTESEELLLIAKEILSNNSNYSNSKIENIEEAYNEIEKLEAEEARISIEIGNIKRRLSEIERLKNGLIDYGNTQKKRVDRLQISKWLENFQGQENACPVCGSTTHTNGEIEILKISEAFKKYEDQSKKTADIPTSFIREEERLKNKLQLTLDEMNRYKKRFDLVTAHNDVAQKEFQTRKNMFIFLGHLQASLETFEKLMDGGELKEEIDKLKEEYNSLQKVTDLNKVNKEINKAVSLISHGILNYLNTLDVDEKYRNVAPRFTIKDLNLSVLSNDGNWHFLFEVGSASNWVSFHIALMCSLQKFFISQAFSCVPNFVIMDQPSQVYFPKLNNKVIKDEKEKDIKYKDTDVEAVRSIFSTISNSIKNESGSWQCIILDHADKSIYGDIDDIYEVVEWRNGNKLIPVEWYE